jgi:hypothetical protein
VTITPQALQWATDADVALMAMALSHYGPETLTGGLAAPLAAGEIRPHWPEPQKWPARQLPSATYGALLLGDALINQAERLWRRNDRAMAARANELGGAMASGRLVLERLAALPELRVQISPGA